RLARSFTAGPPPTTIVLPRRLWEEVVALVSDRRASIVRNSTPPQPAWPLASRPPAATLSCGRGRPLPSRLMPTEGLVDEALSWRLPGGDGGHGRPGRPRCRQAA